MHLDPKTKFDFIIIGAGSAGAALAARLSENSQFSVCLIEAGKKDTHPLVHIPFGLSFLARVKNITWGYDTVPQKQLNNRQLYWPRGKLLGGSSSINAMCYIRGVPEDYDLWERMGATGWNWRSVLPYFKKSENQEHGESDLHGASGYLNVSDLRYTNPISENFVCAAEQLGLDKVKDFNSKKREGLGFYQVTQENGQRCSSAKAYLTKAKDRSNLTIITNALVQKVLIEGGEATGVALVQGGKVIELHARKEVILSAGAINSPQLLMLSGIGPKAHLVEHGIETKVDLPGVGQNLQDHLDAIVQHKCKSRESYAISPLLLPRYIKAAWRYLFKRDDIFSSNIAEAGGFDRSLYATSKPDLQYHFLPAILADHGRKTAFGYGYGLHVCQLYPKSRGQIRLRSSKATDLVDIDPNYLSHPDDQKTLINAVRKAREILNAPAFDEYQSNEVKPGLHVQSDDEVLDFIKAHAESIYHPIGTCKMGCLEEEQTVVSPSLKVKGVRGLRVVDASVMPTIIGGNTNATTIMIAERCADLIKQDFQ